MKKLWIIQPYVPKYRVPFFQGLSSALLTDGIEMKVVAGNPKGAQALRGDASTAEWLHTAESREIRIKSHTLGVSSTWRYWRGADAVIAPLMGSNLDAHRALMRGRSKRRVGLWGHVRPYVAPGNRIDLAIERWQMRQADHIFAYTPGGTQFALEMGIEPGRVTTVMNSVDTIDLMAAMRDMSDAEIADFRRKHKIPDAPLMAYLGGLDSTKRVDFLVKALDLLHERGNSVHFLVAGRGQDEHLLKKASERGQITRLGYVSGSEKAAALRVSSAIVNPGRVGLVAVEALASSLPILTTDWPFHAPEIEYLRSEADVFFSSDDPKAFAELVATFIPSVRLSEPSRLPPTMSSMVENFRSGVQLLLGENGHRAPIHS